MTGHPKDTSTRDRASRWKELAGARELPLPIAMDIWNRGDHQARVRLAGARELPREIEEDIVTGGDAELLVAWLSERREMKLLRSVDPSLSELVRRALALQPELGERERRLIAAAGEEPVLRTLLTRTDLTTDEAREYIVAYVLRSTVKRESYGATLIGLIGEQPETWEALLDQIGPNQIGIVVEAARRRGSPDMHRKAVKALWLLSGKADPRELLRAGEGLLTSPWLGAAEFQQLAELPELAGIRTALHARGAIDVPGLIAMVEICAGQPACTHRGHRAAIEGLAGRLDSTHLPLEALARAATHHPETDVLARTSIYAALSPEATLHISRQTSMRGDHAEAARIIAAARYSVPDIHPETLRQLAAGGSAHALDRTDPAEVLIVLDHYAPLHETLRHAPYAGLIAGHAAALEPEERDTFYRLLWEWESTLDALLVAVTHL